LYEGTTIEFILKYNLGT